MKSTRKIVVEFMVEGRDDRFVALMDDDGKITQQAAADRAHVKLSLSHSKPVSIVKIGLVRSYSLDPKYGLTGSRLIGVEAVRPEVKHKLVGPLC